MMSELESKRRKRSVAPGLLAASLILASASCMSGEDKLDIAEPQALRNGSPNTFRMQGLVDLSDAYNDRSSDLSGVHCSGILLNQEHLLTTARCAQKVMHPGYTVDLGGALLPDVYKFDTYDTLNTTFYKHCVFVVGKSTCNQVENPFTQASKSAQKVRIYSLTSSPENDLAIVSAKLYPNAAVGAGYASIYMDDFTPTTMPRLQLYGWGRAPDTTTYPLPAPRTGTMQVRTVTPSRIDLNPDQVQACSGDEGGAWVVPDGPGGSANEVVALESSFTSDPTTRCSQSGTLDKAVRLRDKMAWIESVIGPCESRTDLAGHHVKYCASEVSCDPVGDGSSIAWDACNGSGCSLCNEKVAGAYPKYFDHHRNCSRNTACNGSYSRCSSNCPPPTVLDTCDGIPDDFSDPNYLRWDGCRGSGCTACSDLIDGTYPKYFANHPECTRNTSCGGEHYRCSASCPPPADEDR